MQKSYNMFTGWRFARCRLVPLCEIRQLHIYDNHIFQIVLTGGPCGGKSTALTEVSARLNQIGYQAFIVPEIPTLFNQCGAGFNPNMNKSELLTYEASVIKAQMAIEDNFIQIAKSSPRPTVILCDRGTMDVSAYLAQEDWKLMLDIENWNASNLRDRRYDAVFHLVSAAIGAEKFYTCENNMARRESPEEAKRLDYAVRDAWLGHPAIRVITNEQDFNKKVAKLVDGVMGVIGLPKPKHHERRWFIPFKLGQMVWNSTEFAQHKNFQDFEIISHYIQSEASNSKLQRRITKRSQHGENSYFFSVRYEDPNDSTMVNTTAQRISTRNYMQLLTQIDESRAPVSKTMRCFLHNNLYFSLNQYHFDRKEDIFILEVEDDSSSSLAELLDTSLFDATSIAELPSDSHTTEEFSQKYDKE